MVIVVKDVVAIEGAHGFVISEYCDAPLSLGIFSNGSEDEGVAL
jgi:hypothetical protein